MMPPIVGNVNQEDPDAADADIDAQIAAVNQAQEEARGENDGPGCCGDGDDYIDFDDSKKGWCILALIAIIIFSACMAESFHYVKYNKQALLQNTYSGVRLGKVYETGRYFFPLNYQLLYFPSSYVEVSFYATTFTDTGLELDVEIGFYYRIPKENLGLVYDSFSNNYNDRVVSNAKTTIKNTAAELGIDIFLTNRSYVEDLFAFEVNAVLRDDLYMDAPTNLFKIGEVILPEKVLERSLESQLAVQRNEILENEQEVTKITSETERLVSLIDVKATQLTAFAENQAVRLKAEAESYANQVNIRARGEGIAALIEELNFNASSKTMAIVKRLAQIDNAEQTTMINVNNAGTNLQVPV